MWIRNFKKQVEKEACYIQEREGVGAWILHMGSFTTCTNTTTTSSTLWNLHFYPPAPCFFFFSASYAPLGFSNWFRHYLGGSLAWFACTPFYTSYEPFHGLQKDVKKKEGEEDATKTETSLSLCKQYAMLFASDTPHLRWFTDPPLGQNDTVTALADAFFVSHSFLCNASLYLSVNYRTMSCFI